MNRHTLQYIHLWFLSNANNYISSSLFLDLNKKQQLYNIFKMYLDEQLPCPHTKQNPCAVGYVALHFHFSPLKGP